MSDTITGVLVLQQSVEPGIFYLWFQYTRADGIIGNSFIPIKDRQTSKPAFRTGPLWDFSRRNPWLDCSPSVRILGPAEGAPDHFHNSGKWSNHYVEMAHGYGQEPSEDYEGRDLCRLINSEKDKGPRDAIILDLRAKGILL